MGRNVGREKRAGKLGMKGREGDRKERREGEGIRHYIHLVTHAHLCRQSVLSLICAYYYRCSSDAKTGARISIAAGTTTKLDLET